MFAALAVAFAVLVWLALRVLTVPGRADGLRRRRVGAAAWRVPTPFGVILGAMLEEPRQPVVGRRREIAPAETLGGAFRPAGKILWDPWFLCVRGTYHAFYLQVPLLEDPEARHHAGVEIGHALSADLREWHERPEALRPGPQSAWDGLALWTGCTVAHGGSFYQFYTGRSQQEFWVQRIGLATSRDLDGWVKRPGVLLEADRRYYTTTRELNALGAPPAWRDPFVFRDPDSDGWLMTISARTAGDQPYNACIALARSTDLQRWEVLPPLLAPGTYDEMEATQVVAHGGRWYLFFSTWAVHYRPAWAQRHGAHSGLHCYVADRLSGPYRPANGNGIVLADDDRRYTVRLVERDGDTYRAVGWLNYDAQGRFVGALSPPLRLLLDGDAVLPG